MRQHPELLKAPALAEILPRAENDAFRRQPRKEAKNILTSRCVWTWRLQADGTRIVECRITVHGFKDVAKHQLDRYNGTPSRWGQVQ